MSEYLDFHLPKCEVNTVYDFVTIFCDRDTCHILCRLCSISELKQVVLVAPST